MSFHRTLAILRKEFHHIARDSRLLFLVTFSPALLLLTFSYVFARDLGQVTLAIIDQDRSRLAREYLAALTADDKIRLVASVSGYPEADRLLVSGRADAVLVIPPGFESATLGGRGGQLQLLVDGADPGTARQVIGEFAARTNAFALQRQQAGLLPPPALDVRTRVLYNPSLKSLISMVPGLMGVFLVMPALALTLALTREKETGTFESLIATPVRSLEYLVGKLTAYLSAGIVSALIAQAVAILWFRVPFRGEQSAFLLLTLIFLSANMGLSVVLANFLKNQQTAMLLMLMVSFVPSFFLSGLITPINTTSWRSLLLSSSLPSTHYIPIGRGVFLKGLWITDLVQPALILFGMAAVALTMGALLFRKQIE